MKKLALTCSAALAAALLVLGLAPPASAYPELTCDASVDHQVVNPGDTFTVTGTATGVDAKNQSIPSSGFSWAFSWNGVTRHRTGAIAQASFKAPAVKRSRSIMLTARSTSPAGTCVRHLSIRVVAASVEAPQSSGGLPGTGGPEFWILVAGVALLAGGGGAVVVSRRRQG